TAARAGRARPAPGQDRDQEAPARGGREQAGQERDEAAAGQPAEAVRPPPPSARTRAPAGEPGPGLPRHHAGGDCRGRVRAGPVAGGEDRGGALPGNKAGDDFGDRVSEDLVEGGTQDPVRPAWPATAGPRAMGTGSPARRAPGQAGDELEEAGPAGFRQSEPAPWDRAAIPRPPDEERDRGEQPAGPGAEPRWGRGVPPAVAGPPAR